jgi:ATP-dependent DNA helicase DinG
MRFLREKGRTEYQGTIVMDDEAWQVQEFDELADVVESSAMRLSDLGESVTHLSDPAGIAECVGRVIRDVSQTLSRFRNVEVGWGASIEGAPHRNPRRITLRLIPVDVSGDIRKLLEETPKGVVAVGRNLRLGGTFDHVRAEWGLDSSFPAVERVLEDSSLELPPLCVPEDMAPPSSLSASKFHWGRYLERTANIIKMIAESLGGRTVVIFSSHHDLREVREILRKNPPRGCITLGQYQDGTKGALIREYISNQSTLLLGGRNFLDDVDLRPAGFTVLVLAKIPFPPPDDAAHKAALRMADASGEDGLRTYLVPLAVKTVNRWMDSLIGGPIMTGAEGGAPGAVVLLDPRALSSDWGEDFLGGVNARPVLQMPFRKLVSELTAMMKEKERK